jgi:hypothetical protein
MDNAYLIISEVTCNERNVCYASLLNEPLRIFFEEDTISAGGPRQGKRLVKSK